MLKRTVWKYELKPGKQLIEMPQNAKILTAQMQNGVAQLWVLVNLHVLATTKREIIVTGTGHVLEVGPGYFPDYITTFQMEDGALVWHVFEIQERK